MKLQTTERLKRISNLVPHNVTALIVINLTLAVVALARDMFLAAYLGTSSQADAFWLAYFLPDTIGNNLLATALGVACIPIFSKLYLSREPDRLKQLITAITPYTLLISLLLYFACFLAGKTVLAQIGAGLGENSRTLCTALLNIILPAVVMFPLISIGSAALQVCNQFNIPALAPVLFNGVLLGGILYGYLRPVPVAQGVYLLAASIPTGVLTMLLLIWHTMKKYRLNICTRPQFAALTEFPEEIKGILKIFIPYLLMLLSTQLIYAIERSLASNLDIGTIAGLNYAFRITQFPLWVFVSAVSTIAFPSMSRACGLGQDAALKQTFGKSLHLVWVITLPLAICLFVLRIPVVSILFQRGSFDVHSIKITAEILAGYTLTIVSQGVAVICLRVYLAIGRALAALFLVACSSGINILLDIYLVKIFGAAGLGYGAAAGALMNALLLLVFLRGVFNWATANQLVHFVKALLANLPVLLIAVLFLKTWYLLTPYSSYGLRMVYACTVLTVSLSVYGVSLHLLTRERRPHSDKG